MIRVTIIYPDGPGARFDSDFYINKHLPTMLQLLRGVPGFIHIAIERSFDASVWGASASLMTCHYAFDTLEHAMLALGDLSGQMRADIVKFSNVTPTVYVNECIGQFACDDTLTRFSDTALGDLPTSWMAPI